MSTRQATVRPFQIVVQRHPMDCAVACLAMLLGKSYEEVLLAFTHNVMARGATRRQMFAAARRLGVELVAKRAVDVEADDGILVVASARWKADHLVMLIAERIIDTDATLWDADVFLAAYRARILGLWTVADRG